jgi:hypothetical protein
MKGFEESVADFIRRIQKRAIEKRIEMEKERYLLMLKGFFRIYFVCFVDMMKSLLALVVSILMMF